MSDVTPSSLANPVPPRPTRRMRRHVWFAAVVLPVLALPTLCYWEAQQVEVTRPVVYVPNLPPAFAGLRIAVLADLHRGPYMSAERIARVVALTNAQKPDLVALTGDYVHRGKSYIPSVWSELARLEAPLGVHAVLGNHDHWEGADLSFSEMAKAGVEDLTNRSHTLERGGQRLVLAGLDDPWAGRPDFTRAVSELRPDDVAVVLCHNPDYIEQVSDPRAALWLAGHTHGGQICLRPRRPLLHPSRCGLRYISGLAAHGPMQIYVSRGVGTVTPPLRLNCRAELPVIELQPSL